MASVSENEIDKNDHVVSSNLNLFQPVPRNHTFLEFRPIYLNPEPDEPYAKKFECIMSKSEYGLMRTDDFDMSGRIKLMAGDTLFNNLNICVYPRPLTNMWCNINLYINDVLVNNITNQYNRISYLKNILYTPYESRGDLGAVNLDILDGSGTMDEVNKIASNTTAKEEADLNGKNARVKLINNKTCKIIDQLDMTLINGYGKTTWITSASDLKFQFARAEKTNYLMGLAGDNPQNYDIHLKDFKINTRMFKPNEQLSRAINNKLIQKNEECHYFVNNMRVVTKTLPIGSQAINCYDVFTGGLPSRVFIVFQKTTRFNGSYQLNCHLYQLLNFRYCCARTNRAVTHEYHG